MMDDEVKGAHGVSVGNGHVGRLAVRGKGRRVAVQTQLQEP